MLAVSHACTEDAVLMQHWDLTTGGLEPGASVYAEGAARPVGKLQVLGEGGAALAVLRMDAAFGAGAAALHAGAPDGPVLRPTRPAWWPPELGAAAGEAGD
jgi:hypothetical protein